MSPVGTAARVAQPETVERAAPRREARIHELPRRSETPVTPAPRRRGVGAFMGLVVGVLVSGLLGLLLLNTTLGEGSFRIKAMQSAVSQLSDQAQQLQQQVALAESPISLSQRAAALGMVPSGSPVFLRLSDGRILGVAVPATVPPPVVAPPAAVVTAPKVPVKATARATATKPATKPATKAGTKPITKPIVKPVTKPKH